MKKLKVIKDKSVYGGMMVDKYFLHFNDGTDMQVPFYEWDQLKAGDTYYIERITDSFGVDPDPFVEAMKDIAKGKTVPLDKALTEEPPIDWKEAHDMQQKLVVHYVLENEKLKDRIKELEAPSESVEKICKQIEKLYRQNEYYRMHNHILETANDDLATMNETMKETLINIWECFEIRSEIYHNDWVGLQALANKARICLEEIGYEWRNDKKDNKS
jgi:cell division protein FtsB